MRAINHALTGAIIGLTISEPAIVIPASLVSHYALDVIPHHGVKSPNDSTLRSKAFRNKLYLDAILCLALVVLLAFQRPVNWLLAIICAALAAAPDLISYRHYKSALDHKKFHPNPYEKFAHDIQWFERPVGAVVEIAWFIAGVIILSSILAV